MSVMCDRADQIMKNECYAYESAGQPVLAGAWCHAVVAEIGRDEEVVSGESSTLMSAIAVELTRSTFVLWQSGIDEWIIDGS